MNRIEINVGTGEQAVVSLSPEEESAALARTAEENSEENRIAKIDKQILDLEHKAIDQGLIRTIIDDLLIRSQAIAAQAGVTEAQLLDPESQHYSRAYAKVHANAVERAVLRSQR